MAHFDLFGLPDIVLEKILLFLSYDEIAQIRIVCKRLDTICKLLLNKGFNAAERYHSQCIKAVKVQLPRRESERRLHPLARHCIILTAIETRLSMLSMTFMKYVDVGLCCFIPGKVIDEVFKVLRFLKECKLPPKTHEILEELRDISSMAMEHFDEKIAPGLKNNRSENFPSNPFSSQFSVYSSGTVCASSSRTFFTQDRLRQEFEKSIRRDQKHSREIQSFRNKLAKHKSRINAQGKKVTSHSHILAEHDEQIAEMKRTIAEMDHKISDLVAELSYVREENGILAAALGIVLNRNSGEVPPVMQPCSSLETNKRKIIDEIEEVEMSKKWKMGKESIFSDKSEDVKSNEKVCSVSDEKQIVSSFENVKKKVMISD